MSKPEYKIATKPLFIGYARAHSPGDRVPVDNIARHGWEDGVTSEGTKAADEATEAATQTGPATPPVGPAPK